jgi:hypothetical protein
MLPSLLQLHILDMEALDLPQFLVRHSHLQELIIESEEFGMGEFMEDIVLPELIFMKIILVHDFPWDRISTPLLRTMETDHESYSARAFICRHPSIRDLRYFGFVGEFGFKDIAKSMVNLRSLFISGFIDGLFKEIDPDVPFPPFPNLIALTLDQRYVRPISLENFEQLLRTCCLPREPSESNNTQRISSLEIYLPTIKLNSVQWRQSALLTHVPQTVTKLRNEEANCVVRFKIPK